MKKLIPLFVILVVSAGQLRAQEVIIISDTLSGWNYSWVAGLNGSQAAYSNWAQGGVNNINVNGNSTLSAMFRDGQFAYGFMLGTRYGRSRIEGEGTRKTDDYLSVRNRFLYDLAEQESVYSLFADINFRTQFDKGYEYGAAPDGGDILISRFMAPAYFSQGAGLAYIPSGNFSFEAGLGLKQTIVTDDDLETLYGLDEGDTIRNEAGFTLGASYEQSIASNFILSSSLETFSNLNRSLASTDIYFANEFIGKINNFMNASLRVDLVYDDDFSEQIQVLQVVSLGVSFILM